MPKVIDVIRVLEELDPNKEVKWMLPVEWPYTGSGQRSKGDTSIYMDEVLGEAKKRSEVDESKS